MFQTVSMFFGRFSRQQAADNEVYSREQGEDVNKQAKLLLGDAPLEPHAKPCAHRHKQAKGGPPLEAAQGDEIFLHKQGQLDPVDSAKEDNTGGDVVGLRQLLGQQEDIYHGPGTVGKGAGEAGADATGNARQMAGLPRGRIFLQSPAHKLPTDEPNRQ